MNSIEKNIMLNKLKTINIFLFVVISVFVLNPSFLWAKSAPNAIDDTAETSQNISVMIDVLANDTDADGDALYIYDISNQASHGSAEVIGFSVKYTPQIDYSGTDSFSYRIIDQHNSDGTDQPKANGSNSDTATVTVTITENSISPDYGDANISSLVNWPLWPDQSEVSNNPIPPLSFTSVGRDVIASVTFSEPSSREEAWGSVLKVLRKEDETTFPELHQDLSFEQSGFGIRFCDSNGSLVKFKDNYSISNSLVPSLEVKAVIPVYVEDWFSFTASPDITYENQSFIDDWLLNWYDFLEGTGESPKAGEVLADSGHASPLPVWKTNYWITRFVDPGGIPADWPEDEPIFFFPTNDGLLNKFEIQDPDTDPTLKRNWALIPDPAIQMALYQENLQTILGYYPRLTNLDGPVFVHDVQGTDGTWKRIMIGTTGMSSYLKNKPLSAWREENEDYNIVPQNQELLPVYEVGRFFGIYAIDVTDPDEPVYLWDRTNIYWDRNNPSLNFESSNPRDLEIDYVCSRPLIGMTGEQNNLTWHALIVGMEFDEDDGTYYYHWYDLNPLTGATLKHGRFTDQALNVEEAIWYILAGDWSSEEWDPSRILAAYPKDPGAYGLPVLSDVYVYLSNGSCYLWNIQDGKSPWKLFSTVTNNGPNVTNPAPPMQDFDIAYFDEEGESGTETHTYLAAVLEVNFNASNPHDTTNLFVIDLDASLGDYLDEKYVPKILAMQGSQGQVGDTVTMIHDRIDGGNLVVDEGFEIELQYDEQGQSSEEFDKLVATPLFIDGVLYLAVYSSTADGGVGLSRLYTLDMDTYVDLEARGASTSLEETVDYLDFPGDEFISATVGSDGVLYIPKTDGTVYSKDLGVEFGINEDSGDVSADFADTVQVYWKVRN